MNKNLNYNFAKNIDQINAGTVPYPPVDNPVEVEVSESDSLLRIIYSIGSDGYPVGDLAVYAGKNASPEVKKFILDNLMQDVSGHANPASVGLSDDEITSLTRQSGESMSDYAVRLNSSIEKDRFILNASKRSVSNDKVQNQPTE